MSPLATSPSAEGLVGSRTWCSGQQASSGAHAWPSEWLSLSAAGARGDTSGECSTGLLGSAALSSHFRWRRPRGKRAARAGAGLQGSGWPPPRTLLREQRTDSAAQLERRALLQEPLAVPGSPRARTRSDQIWENMPEVWERNRMRPAPSFPVLLSQGIKFPKSAVKGKKA